MKKIIAIMIAFVIIGLFGAQNGYVYAQAEKNPTIPFVTDKNLETAPKLDPEIDNIKSKDIGDPFREGEDQLRLPTFDIRTSGIRWALAALFFISTPLLFIMALYSGINMVIRPENEEVVAKSRRTLIFSALGLALMAFAYAIVQNVLNLF